MQTTSDIALMNNILKFDQLVRDFSVRHREEFRVYLEFPALAKQRENKVTLTGYKDEVLFCTAEALTLIENSKKITPELSARLRAYINDFLELEAKSGKMLLTTEERKICLDLLQEINFSEKLKSIRRHP